MLTICKYRFLTIVRNKVLLFWNMIFPLVLVTFFGVTLPNAYKTLEIETIPIAMVDNVAFQQDQIFKTTLKTIEDAEESIFHVTYVSLEGAQRLLKNGEVEGIIEKQEEFQIQVKEDGVNQTILQTFMDEYLQKSSLIMHLVEGGASYDQIMMSMEQTTSYISSKTNENSDISSVYFYTIIAMCCLYGSYISMGCIHSVQANQSNEGARNSISPFPKSKLIFLDFIISYVIGFTILMILWLYMMFGLGINFGEHVGYILLCIAAGVLAGNSLGILVGAVIIKNKEFKTGILTTTTLTLSMLSGMMMVQIKYFMDTYVPFINRMNPANMITDALYSLYYYGPDTRYFVNLISLLIFSGICYAISFIVIRRKQYASI